MKKFVYTITLSFILWSCGGSGGDEPAPTPVNEAPSTPELVGPANNELCIDSAVTFSWNASADPEGDAITYQLEIAQDNQFASIDHTLYVSGTSKAVSLERGVAYYWRVKATDINNAASAYSATYQFYTEGAGSQNHIPFVPTLVSPGLNAIVQEASTTLTWTASDVDNDPLTFDVYFGTTNPPDQVATDQTELSYDVSLEASSTYYWKVVVKDDKGGEAIGQVWGFKTD
ncbi:MAG: hypothetical protein QGH06_06125 [Lutibacter sp.]|jgi:hypothetical protein|nr:hypothetical protein [Lutibacter sp.]